MKRYVTEYANDLSKALLADIRAAKSSPAVVQVLEKRLDRISRICEQCRYGYIPEFIAVKLLSGVNDAIKFEEE